MQSVDLIQRANAWTMRSVIGRLTTLPLRLTWTGRNSKKMNERWIPALHRHSVITPRGQKTINYEESYIRMRYDESNAGYDESNASDSDPSRLHALHLISGGQDCTTSSTLAWHPTLKAFGLRRANAIIGKRQGGQ